MALTNAELQARYRQRHLKDGTSCRINTVVNATTCAALARLARHRGITLRETLETVLAQAEAAATRRMSPESLKIYLGEDSQ